MAEQQKPRLVDMMKAFELKEFQKRIGVTFKNQALLREALTHRSYHNEHREVCYSNERLELLGDAVLRLILAEYMYKEHPSVNEGQMTTWLSQLQCGETLAAVAENIGLSPIIAAARGQSTVSSKVLEDAYEALLGAIYLDRGIAIASKLALKHLTPVLEMAQSPDIELEPKSKLQHIIQGKLGVTPSYNIIKETGKDHEKSFTVGVYAGDILLAKGEGQSTKKASLNAARNALRMKRWEV